MDLKEIKNKLPHGGIKIIAEKCGIVEGTVRNILNGNSKTMKSIEVIKVAIEIINDINKDIEKIKESLKGI